ncbi:hypothetical protein DNTS_025271 [Danionella cerebrum]|uniref:Splicing regulatory glutamine/lysine-rich protein 1 n=1 Tax=Danionella cerebrum TaxID=2873325 RepID=A0A553PIJ2_9TELE|nr:hypothetical protein DNTS_025271 [Danionella translucida]
MSGMPVTNVVQVTNLSAAVISDQMRTLFGFLGDIEELRLYPPDNAPLSFSSKVCYIKYREPSSVGVAQHLTNTVFIDRALIVVPCAEGKIPEEAKALSLLAPATPVASLMSGGGLLPIPTPATLQNRGLPLANLGVLKSSLDSTVANLSAMTSLPPLVGNIDPSKVDEIRRTVYVGNLNSQNTTAEQLLQFFKQVGDVKFVRMAGDETQPTRFAFVEFSDQDSVARALTYNGALFGDRPLKINHSNNAIVKPPELTPQAAAKELEDVMKRVREAQSTIAAAIEPEIGLPRDHGRGCMTPVGPTGGAHAPEKGDTAGAALTPDFINPKSTPGKKDKRRDKGREASKDRGEGSRKKRKDSEHKSKTSPKASLTEDPEHQFDSDFEGSGSGCSENHSSPAHQPQLNGCTASPRHTQEH